MTPCFSAELVRCLNCYPKRRSCPKLRHGVCSTQRVQRPSVDLYRVEGPDYFASHPNKFAWRFTSTGAVQLCGTP